MPRAGRRRSVVWECFDEPPATELRRRVICHFCGHDVVANPLRMARHVAQNCPRADDAHRRLCSEYRGSTGGGAPTSVTSISVSGARGSLSPLSSASMAAASRSVEPETMETEEPLENVPQRPSTVVVAAEADESREWQLRHQQQQQQQDEEPLEAERCVSEV